MTSFPRDPFPLHERCAGFKMSSGTELDALLSLNLYLHKRPSAGQCFLLEIWTSDVRWKTGGCDLTLAQGRREEPERMDWKHGRGSRTEARLKQSFQPNWHVSSSSSVGDLNATDSSRWEHPLAAPSVPQQDCLILVWLLLEDTCHYSCTSVNLSATHCRHRPQRTRLYFTRAKEKSLRSGN